MFAVTFAFIWLSGYADKDYLQGMPEDPTEYHKVLKANTWRAVYSIVLFMGAFAYLKPYKEYGIGEPMQRIHRLIVMIVLLYTCWLIYML